MAACLHAGDSLILFPEGTRNTGDEVLLPFKSGLYHLARACPEVRLVPVWIENLKPRAAQGQLAAGAAGLQRGVRSPRWPCSPTKAGATSWRGHVPPCWPCVRMGMTEAGHRPVPADRPVATAATGTFGSGR
jgi:hypothetical protein